MRPRHSPFRWLAPLALVACAVAVYSIVNANSADDRGTQSTATKSASGKAKTAAERSKTTKRRARPARTYTVKPGDTLSSIAEQTGVTLQRIQELNPDIDSQALQTGQRVKLSP
jgi:LysM repeat protein